jgi:hypothetical protein
MAIPHVQHGQKTTFGKIVEAVAVHLIGAVLLEANGEWATQTRYMQLEAMAELLGPPLIEGDAIPAGDAAVTPEAA